ncbi:MAG: hypothetical protein KAT43_03820 [Nanoarchaeota archaeon]|nr:hypothetical protein [Nanoarchaeota archaeon]
MAKKELLNWKSAFHSAGESKITLYGKIGFCLVLLEDITPERKKQYLARLSCYGSVEAEEGFTSIELFITDPNKLEQFKKDALEGRLDDEIDCVAHISPHPVRLGYEMGLNEWY